LRLLARRPEALECDARVAEQHVAGDGVGNEVDRHALFPTGDPDDGLRDVGRDDHGLDGLVRAGDAALLRGPAHTAP
jgi:hypothetical protein